MCVCEALEMAMAAQPSDSACLEASFTALQTTPAPGAATPACPIFVGVATANGRCLRVECFSGENVIFSWQSGSFHVVVVVVVVVLVERCTIEVSVGLSVGRLG